MNAIQRALRLAAAGLVALTLAAAAGVALGVATDDSSSPSAPPRLLSGAGPPAVGQCDSDLGRFGPGNWPPACWRPYNDSSPFNRRIPIGPRIDPNSAAVVQRLMGFDSEPQQILAGQAGTKRDGGHPTYWSQPGDPLFTVHCTKHFARRCALEGLRIRIPDQAQVPGGSDGHMTVVDQTSGWEYDMWQVKDKPEGGGTIVISWGGKTRIDGDGLGSDAVAGEYGTLAGIMRAEELQAGEIDHALFMFVECDSGAAVYPAVHDGRACTRIGQSDTNAPAMGMRFQLVMTDEEIDALHAPPWKEAILRAMRDYGMYVGDTGGSWGVKEEGGLTYTSFGQPDKWVELARSQGGDFYEPHQLWTMDLGSGVDWAHRLRVIDPCEADDTCS